MFVHESKATCRPTDLKDLGHVELGILAGLHTQQLFLEQIHKHGGVAKALIDALADRVG
jgi:hypothetical protein